jgi:hypothetical protein
MGEQQMLPQSLEALVARVVEAVAIVLLGEQVSAAPLLSGADLDRARAALSWLMSHLDYRASEALDDLRQEPSSEDNKADLRKQLMKFLERQPSAADSLNEIVPESFAVEPGGSVAARVGSALNIASGSVGIFGSGRGRNE